MSQQGVKIDVEKLKEQCKYQWKQILGFVGIDQSVLTNKHKACPACGDGGKGGKSDRFRFDDKSGDGDYFCSQCGAGDGISLVQKVCNCDFQAAIKTVADIVNYRQIEPTPAPKKKEPEWEPIIPIPESELANLKKEFVDVWNESKSKSSRLYPKMVSIYRDVDGNAHGAVLRCIGADGIKWTPQVLYSKNKKTGELKFTYGSMPYPRELYGSEHLKEAKSVLIVEGEKTVEAVRKIIGTKDRAIITWCGGTNVAERNKWENLKGKKVIIFPDSDHKIYPDTHKKAGQEMPYNDQPGQKAALEISKQLTSRDISHKIISTKNLPSKDGWDLADGIQDGWDAKKIMDYVMRNMVDPPAVKKKEEQKEKQKPNTLVQSDIQEVLATYIRFMGYEYDKNFYYSHERNQVIGISASQHTKQTLYSLAPESMWSVCFPHHEEKSKAKFDYELALDYLNRRSAQAGHYDPRRVRKCGAWYDRNQVLIHLGDRLKVGDKEVKLEDWETDFIYESQSRIEYDCVSIATKSDLKIIRNAFDSIKWKSRTSAIFAAGWAVLAPISGLLAWRPHIWIMGGTGTGKSTIASELVLNLLGGLNHPPSGRYSEPGVRQMANGKPLPIYLDEAEGKETWSKEKMQKLLELAKNACSDNNSASTLGTTGGNVRIETIRSMFMFVSIQDSIKEESDRNRIAVLEVQRLDEERRKAHWDSLKLEFDKVDKAMGQRLINHTLSKLPMLQTSILAFKGAIGEALGSARLGDTYGTLVAGWWLIAYDRVPNVDDLKLVCQLLEHEVKEEHSENDEESLECLSYILQTQIRYENSGSPRMKTIGELVSLEIECQRANPAMFADSSGNEDRRVLSQLGIRVNSDGSILIANRSFNLQKSLGNSPYATNWKSFLQRIDGVKKSVLINFGSGLRSRCTQIPYEKLNLTADL